MEYLIITMVAFFVGFKISELKNFILDARIEKKVAKCMSAATRSEPKKRFKLQVMKKEMQEGE